MSTKSFDRMPRVNDVIHRILAECISTKFKDPRVGFVTILEVETSKDLRNAKIFFTVLEEEKGKETLEVLNKARGYLRTILAQSAPLRYIPELRFYLDDSNRVGRRIDSLLEYANLSNN